MYDYKGDRSELNYRAQQGILNHKYALEKKKMLHESTASGFLADVDEFMQGFIDGASIIGTYNSCSSAITELTNAMFEISLSFDSFDYYEMVIYLDEVQVQYSIIAVYCNYDHFF